ncbi:autotransporter adhesin BpaC-like [Stegodyphus dumicola]|uniref:autotransporter adhesin BpaC-like n=1 Tax=Stegodyphus dumicola TaxID=202533 RepID=UPI0015AA3042|nr:autotransporter adhesin BpaC-like [Stegodyphus dumicola]
MGCTIRITTLLLVFCTQGFIAYGSVQPIWSNPELAENILGSFTEYLLKSGIFSSEQIDDISSISQTILDAFGRSGFSNNISSSKTRALNMALASSVAELVLSENPSFPLSDIIRAITDGLRDSMLKNSGGVDEVSLKEINQLINMIAADRLNEGSDVSSRSEETQNAFDGTANAPGYDPSSSTSSQGYRPDTKPNDRYNARASGAERPFQRYGASQPTEVAAVTSQGFSDVSYRPANAEAFSQNVGLNTFGSTGDLGFGHDSTAVASANAPSYSDYYKQGGNRQAYPMARDRAPGDAGRDDQGFQESGYPVDIIRDNKATEFGQGGRESTGYAKAKGFPEASSDGAAANNIRQGYRNSYKDRVYNARRDSSIPSYGNDREIISSSRDIDVISKFTNTITSSLLSSNDFTSTFRSGLPVTNAVNLASNLARSFATQFGLDDTTINSLLSLVSQYISGLGPSADVSAYANAISRAIGDTIENTGNVSPILTTSLASADTKPIANLISSVTSATVNAQQPNLVPRIGGSNFKNLAAKQVQENRQNFPSVQSAVGTRIQPSLSRFPGHGANAAASGGGGQAAEIPSTTGDIDVISQFTNTITSSLLSSNDFTSTFVSGLPVTIALNLASNLAQSLASQIGLDEAGINSLLSLLSQYISAIDPSADASAYANAVSLAIGNTLANAGNVSPVLTASLASADTQQIANLISSVTSSTINAQKPNIIRSGVASTFRNVPLTQVQLNRGNVGAVQSSVATRLEPLLTRLPGQGSDAAASAADEVGQGVRTSATATNIDVISKFTNTISSGLLASNDFSSIFGSGLPVTTALNLASNLAQSLATQIGLDEAGINSLLSLLRQYILSIGSTADASTYANAVSLAIGNTLANAGNVSPALTASIASADPQPIANLVSLVTSSTLNTQHPNIIRSRGASNFRNVPLKQVLENRGNLGSVQSGQGAAATAAEGVVQGSGTSSTATDIDVISKFTNTISSGLLASNDFTSVFGSGLPVTTALNLASNLAQSLGIQIGLDEAAINSLLSLLSQYISAIDSSADASAYANALSLAIGNTLENARNVSPALTASLASADTQPIANLVRSVTSSTLTQHRAQQPNIIRSEEASNFRNVPLTQVQGNRGNVDSVQSSVGTRLQPSLSRFPGAKYYCCCKICCWK